MPQELTQIKQLSDAVKDKFVLELNKIQQQLQSLIKTDIKKKY